MDKKFNLFHFAKYYLVRMIFAIIFGAICFGTYFYFNQESKTEYTASFYMTNTFYNLDDEGHRTDTDDTISAKGSSYFARDILTSDTFASKMLLTGQSDITMSAFRYYVDAIVTEGTNEILIKVTTTDEQLTNELTALLYDNIPDTLSTPANELAMTSDISYSSSFVDNIYLAIEKFVIGFVLASIFILLVFYIKIVDE